MKKFNYILSALLIMTAAYTPATNITQPADVISQDQQIINFQPANAFKKSNKQVCKYNTTEKTAKIYSKNGLVSYKFKDVVAAGPNIRMNMTKLVFIGSYVDTTGTRIQLYGVQV